MRADRVMIVALLVILNLILGLSGNAANVVPKPATKPRILLAMFRRRSSTGMNPRMAAILGIFQILWVYYGSLIASRPVIAWNIVAVLVNSVSVGAYCYFICKERATRESQIAG